MVQDHGKGHGMAQHEYMNVDEQNASGSKSMVFVPTSLPIVSNLSMDALMAHFSDDVFDKTPTSHMRHLLEAIAGPAGFGELLRQSVEDWLDGGVETAWLGFVDRLFAQIYGLPRIWDETVAFDPTDALVTTDEYDQVLIAEAWYKARFVDLMRAMNCGGTVKGFKYAVRAITFGECDLYETWRYAAHDFEVGRLGHTLYNEVVIAPYNTFTPFQRDLLLRVLDRIKPANVVVTVEPLGLAVDVAHPIRSVSATSSAFEVVRTLTNAVDNSVLPPTADMYAGPAPHGYDTLPGLGIGQSAEVPLPVMNHVQEYGEYYVCDASNASQIEAVTYGQSEDGVSVEPADDWTDRVTDVRWSAWRRFAWADSPDNYPGGKYGQHPKTAPALAKDGSPYVFEWESQEAYETAEGARIVDGGGEVSGHTYRTVLSRSTSSVTYLPEMAVASVNDVSGRVTSLPSSSLAPTANQYDDLARALS